MPLFPSKNLPSLIPYILSKGQLGPFTPQCPGGLGSTSYLQEVGSPLLTWAGSLSPSTGSSLVRKKMCNGTLSCSLAPGHTLLTRPQKSRQAPAQRGGPGNLKWPRAITIFFVLERIFKNDAIFIACQKHPNCFLITLQRKP